HHARIGAPPQNRLAAAEPGKYPPAIGIDKACGRQFTTRSQQAVRLGQRLGQRGKGIAFTQPTNHGVILPIGRWAGRRDDAEVGAGNLLRKPAPTRWCRTGPVSAGESAAARNYWIVPQAMRSLPCWTM